MLGHEDYALALWSEATGLALEDEQRCERDANTQIKCRHAADVLAEMVNGSTADELNIPAVTKAVISAPKDCMAQLMDILSHHPQLVQVEISPVSLADSEGVTGAVGDVGEARPGVDVEDTATGRRHHRHLTHGGVGPLA